MPDSHLLIDRNGRRITRPQVQQAMRINIAAGSLGMVWMAMSVNMPLTMFMEATGASGFLIGLLMMARLLAMGAQIPAAFIAEHLGSRKAFWAPMALVHRSLWFAVAGFALCWKPGAWWVPLAVIALVAVSDTLGNAAANSWYSWLLDLIPIKEAGRFWGRRQSIVTAASLAGMGAAGYLMDRFRIPETGKTTSLGFGVVFGIAAVCGVSDVLVHLSIREPRPAPKAPRTGVLKRIAAPLRDRDFRQLTLCMGAWSYATTMMATFSMVYFKRDFPVTYTHVACLTIAGALGSVVTSFVFGALTDRLGPRVLCAILMILAPVTTWSWFFADTTFVTFQIPWVGPWTLPRVVANQTVATFIGGSLFSGIAPCQLRLASLLSKSPGRTMALAVHWSLIGSIASLGALTGGWIMDWFTAHPVDYLLASGSSFSFMHVICAVFTLVVWGVALPLVLSIRAPVDHFAFSEAVARMFLVNPVNAVRNFYSLQVMSAPASARVRAQAARSLGVHKSGMAVPELAGQLNDPAMAVQEEAVEALGAIGTPEAVDALLEKLDDPGCDLYPQICHALRNCADTRCVEPLLRRLQDGDRETLSESARTLGQIGDRRAIPHLLNLMTQSRDGKVLAACSEALAALGELSAAYQIIPQMRAMPNRMLKRALALAVGDLLGEKEAFYQLLVADTESSGSGASQAANDLARVIKKRFPHARSQLETLECLEAAYHEGNAGRSAELLLHLGLHLAGFLYRLPITLDPNEAMQRLLERDQRAAIGIWYLKICNEPWEVNGADARDLTDILLGLHIVASFTAPGRGTRTPE